jgi:hypothetical protein
MDVCLNENVDTANTIKLKLYVFVFTPVSHSAHVLASCIELLVALNNHCVFRQAIGEFSALVRFDP